MLENIKTRKNIKIFRTIHHLGHVVREEYGTENDGMFGGCKGIENEADQ